MKINDPRRGRDDIADLARAYFASNDSRRPWNGRPSGSRFQLIRDDALETMPSPEALVAGTLYCGSLVSIFGKPATFKSFVALGLACCVGTGIPWHGRAVRAGLVVYVCAEGAQGITKRVRAWKQAHHVEGSAGVYVVTSPAYLTDTRQVRALLDEISTLPEAPVLIIIDTLNRNMQGSENDPDDMSRFIAGCDLLRSVIGAAVLVVHHTGHDREANHRGRGHSSWPCALDTEVLVERRDDRVTLICTKQKDAAPFAPIQLRLVPTHCSLVATAMGNPTDALGASDRKILRVFQDFPSDALTPKEVVAKTELSQSTVYRGLNNLEGQDLVVKDANRWRLGGKGITRDDENSQEFSSTFSAHERSSSQPGGEYSTPPLRNEVDRNENRERDHA